MVATDEVVEEPVEEETEPAEEAEVTTEEESQPDEVAGAEVEPADEETTDVLEEV